MDVLTDNPMSAGKTEFGQKIVETKNFKDVLWYGMVFYTCHHHFPIYHYELPYKPNSNRKGSIDFLLQIDLNKKMSF